MDVTSVVNISNETNSRKRPKQRKSTAGIPRKPINRGTGTPLGRPMFEAVALQPPPPCDHPSLGRCPFYERCSETGEICPAFTKYVNLKFYTGGKDRIPNRHFNDLYYVDDVGSLDRVQSSGIIPTEGRAVHAEGPLEGPDAEPALGGPDVRSPPQAGSTVHTDTHIHFIEQDTNLHEIHQEDF